MYAIIAALSAAYAILGPANVIDLVFWSFLLVRLFLRLNDPVSFGQSGLGTEWKYS
jgi:hypothetical protein